MIYYTYIYIYTQDMVIYDVQWEKNHAGHIHICRSWWQRASWWAATVKVLLEM